MGKRKSTAEEKLASKDKMDVDGEENGSEEEEDDASIINIDFEWFGPRPEIDFHGLKMLLRQLFDVDNDLFDLSELTDLILAQPTLGSTVKCEGEESDPYAFLTVLNMHHHREKAVMKQLSDYLISKASPSETLRQQLRDLLSPDSQAQVGLILTERFINMPSEIVPPMYNMIRSEIAAAVEDKELYEFTHYLLISKTYTEVASKLDAEEDRPQKKNKKATDAAPETFYFHPEDEALHRYAMGVCNYDYEKVSGEGASDAKRTFQELGVKPQGHLILIEGKRFEEAVKGVGEYLGGDAVA
ncbi:hypothetical protein D0864_14929 [Hortaea werneckii]|uniref:Protein BCP1 n=1 Tax=Hortaea werneckii TaxID=91943 RepID=A0A3M7C860_HORWE|nr:hypothetical protein KC352_g21442 [Hortaea werneckii]KAI7550908.1 hypothetical protein KC317_g14139 [Hortaea werneckii]KAI7601136.1 hypothetical protein KC346_g12952 [Hortaea werneckii]KAI7648989.1 hypothetical protein KC319_g11318 [Hortaea werneckii]KAI7687273.1 hypothetical protein KC322_g12516 [Hortaea werneckii]